VAQLKSAKKSIRKDELARMSNRSWKSRIKTARRKLESAIEGSKTDTINDLFREYESVVDRAVSKGVLHKNTASRKKTIMAQRMKHTDGAPQPLKKPAKSRQAKPAKAAVSDAASEEKGDVKTSE
jgi:small subunit ribosomal protein S20